MLSDLFSFLSDHPSPQVQAGYILAPSKGGSLALRIRRPLGWVLGTLGPGSCQLEGETDMPTDMPTVGAQGSESNGEGLREPCLKESGFRDRCLSRKQPEEVKAFQGVGRAQAKAQSVGRHHVAGSSGWPSVRAGEVGR